MDYYLKRTIYIINMLLQNREVDVLLRDFPQIKLPYENLIHNKVFNSDIIFAIPEGKKYFLWFTEYNDKNHCFQLELNEKNNVVRVEKRRVCFNSVLCYNTILYGTITASGAGTVEDPLSRYDIVAFVS